MRSTLLSLIVALLVSATAWLSAQGGSSFQFIVSATDAKGQPVADLKPDDVIMSEKAGTAKVTKVEPFALPVKVTIAVDNSGDSAPALPNYRAGLKGFVEAFPADTEMTIITTSPQPRMVVKPTTDRATILRGVNGFAPESGGPRFTDALVEFSQRLEKEARDKVKLYVPVLLMVSTAANEAASYQPAEVDRAIRFLITRRAKLFVIITSTRSGDASATADLNTNRQVMIAEPVTKALDGRLETIAIFNRLDTLLPEMGGQLAAYAKRLSTQYLVTVQRASAGPIQEPSIGLAREGLTGAVSTDGYIPR
jgi:hypothetical protein